MARVHRLQPVKLRRQHRGDAIEVPAEFHAAADDIHRRSQTLPPEPVSESDRRLRIRRVGRGQLAQDRTDAEQVEVVVGNDGDQQQGPVIAIPPKSAADHER